MNAQVRLTMPARPELLRVARLTAAALAGRLGFGLDDIDDTRIAVDELCFLLVGAQGRDGTVSVTYHLADDHLVIEGTGHFTSAPPPPEPSELSARILAVVADEHELDSSDHELRFRLVKRRTS